MQNWDIVLVMRGQASCAFSGIFRKEAGGEMEMVAGLMRFMINGYLMGVLFCPGKI